jgi:hypothetical protein
VSSDDRQTTADTARSTARGEELREELAITDARRAEEEVAKQHEEVEAAQKEEEKLSRKERKAAERAEQAAAAAERAREKATVSGATVAGPGVGSEPRSQAAAADGAAAAAPEGESRLPAAAQRPEVMAGAAFGGAFILARVLKRLFD